MGHSIKSAGKIGCFIAKKKKDYYSYYTQKSTLERLKTEMLKVKAYTFKKNLLEIISMTALEGLGVGWE